MVKSRDTQKLISLIESYRSNAQDWHNYSHFDADHPSKNLVDDGNANFHLFVQCWFPGMRSGFLALPSTAIVKVLQGQIIIRERKMNLSQSKEKYQFVTSLVNDKTCGAGTTIDLSTTTNLFELVNDFDTTAVTLHLYTPPQTTVRRSDEIGLDFSTEKVVWYSIFGEVQKRPSLVREGSNGLLQGAKSSSSLRSTHSTERRNSFLSQKHHSFTHQHDHSSKGSLDVGAVVVDPSLESICLHSLNTIAEAAA